MIEQYKNALQEQEDHEVKVYTCRGRPAAAQIFACFQQFMQLFLPVCQISWLNRNASEERVINVAFSQMIKLDCCSSQSNVVKMRDAKAELKWRH